MTNEELMAHLGAQMQQADEAMLARNRELLGSASERFRAVEDLIDALDPRHATGIDRSSRWWE